MDALDYEKKTPLHTACEYGKKSIAGFLLKNNANPDALSDRQFTPLYLASCFGYTGIMQMLIDSGAKIDAIDDGGPNPLTAAVSNGEYGAVKVLLENGADLNRREKDENGSECQSCLHTAACNESLDIVKILVEHGAELNIINDMDQTPLDCAVLYGWSMNAKYLIEQGADPEHAALSPLHVSIILNRTDDFHAYIDENQYLDLPDRYDNCPVHWAIDFNNIDFLQTIIEAGADLSRPNGHGYCPLHLAVIKDLKEIILKLIDSGVDVNQKIADHVYQEGGMTALHLACRKKKADIVDVLLKSRADVNVKNKEGLTPVWTAVLNNNFLAVKILETNGADLTVLDERTQTTLLHAAAWKLNKEIIEFLIERGLDVNARDDQGKTPLWYTEEYKEIAEEVVAVLKKHGGK